MPLSNPDLMNKISRHLLSDPTQPFSFLKRLERDNNWDGSYARLAMVEYKRFCYLAMVATHEVTPSDEVDQVWHLHLLNTKNYWDEFCGSVLGKPLHHEPTKGGSNEHQRFVDNYETTLKLYQQEFDDTPPPDLWPKVRKRFARAPNFQRVNTAGVLMFPVPMFLYNLFSTASGKSSQGSSGNGGVTGCGGCSGCGGGCGSA